MTHATAADPAGLSPLTRPPRDRGETRLSDRVVRKIATQAAGEVVGAGLGARASVTVREGRARLRLGVGLRYPVSIVDVTRRVRAHVADQITRITGLRVDVVDLVVDLESTDPRLGRRVR